MQHVLPNTIVGSAQNEAPKLQKRPLQADSEIGMVDGALWDESFEQDRSWDDSGTIMSGI